MYNEDGFDQRILEWVRRVDGVRLAVPITSADTMLILGDVEVAVKVFGVDPTWQATRINIVKAVQCE